jgi:hypothetical protein
MASWSASILTLKLVLQGQKDPAISSGTGYVLAVARLPDVLADDARDPA